MADRSRNLITQSRRLIAQSHALLARCQAKPIEPGEQQFHFLVELIPQIVWTARADGKAEYFNRRWAEYTGLSAELTISGGRSVVHPEDFERYRKTWAAAIATGTLYEVEYRLRRFDGVYRWHLGR